MSLQNKTKTEFRAYKESYAEIILKKYFWHYHRYLYHQQRAFEIAEKLEDIKNGKSIPLDSEKGGKSSTSSGKSPHEKLVIAKTTHEEMAIKNIKEMQRVNQEEKLNDLFWVNREGDDYMIVTEYLRECKTFEQISDENGASKQYRTKQYRNAIKKLEKDLLKEW